MSFFFASLLLWLERERERHKGLIGKGHDLRLILSSSRALGKKSYVNSGETCPLYFRWASTRQRRGEFSLVHPSMNSKLKPQTEMANSLIGKNFDVGGFPFIIHDIYNFG